jgi:hypothetical protein
MSKKFLRIFLCLCSFLLISSNAVFAADTNIVQSSPTSNNSANIISNLSSKDYNELKLQIAELVKENKQNNDATSSQKITIHQLDAAPILSSVSVYEVYSHQYGSEYIASNQMLTQNSYANITGSEYIITLDWGYGVSPFAAMNNNELNCVEIDGVNENGGIDQPGTVSVGFLRVWDASTYRTGAFTYDNRTNGHLPLYTRLSVQ